MKQMEKKNQMEQMELTCLVRIPVEVRLTYFLKQRLAKRELNKQSEKAGGINQATLGITNRVTRK